MLLGLACSWDEVEGDGPALASADNALLDWADGVRECAGPRLAAGLLCLTGFAAFSEEEGVRGGLFVGVSCVTCRGGSGGVAAKVEVLAALGLPPSSGHSCKVTPVARAGSMLLWSVTITE